MGAIEYFTGRKKRFFRIKRYSLFSIAFGFIIASCTSPRYIGRTDIPGKFLDDPAVSDSHVGIALYDPESRSYLYRYNSHKFFVPASNIKIYTLYAGLKYLGDSIPGIEYAEHNDTIFLKATGDPAFLLADYPVQPVFDFLAKADRPLVFIEPEWETDALGFGWPWNNYLDYYQAERSPFPVYGNGILWVQKGPDTFMKEASGDTGKASGLAGGSSGVSGEISVLVGGSSGFAGEDFDLTGEDSGRAGWASGLAGEPPVVVSITPHPWPVEIMAGTCEKFEVKRPFTKNIYTVYLGPEGERDLFVPFATNCMQAALDLLEDTLGKEIGLIPVRSGLPEQYRTVYSRAADSLFLPMMFQSKNFIAEQTLMMVSRELFGVMDEKRLIDSLLKNDLKELPQMPRWVDGSGLSRYNLSSPESFVRLLEKMADEFGFERVSHLLPTGGEGTLEDLYKDERGRIFAKTGTLGGNAISLSGFLITRKERPVIFSVLVNNHHKESREVREAVERFLKEFIYRY